MKLTRFIGTFTKIFAVVSLALMIGLLYNQPSTVNADVSLPGNMFANSSVEIDSAGWNKDKWGTNTTTFTYDSTGHNGNHSLSTSITKYTSGDAKWYPNAVAVTPSTSYTFSNWYQSNVTTEVDAVITTTAGKTTYKFLGNVAASSTWKQTSFKFTTPANASKITIFHYINKVGKLTVRSEEHTSELQSR